MGKDTDNQAWLLVQHADHDPFFQAGCLFILGKLVEVNETSKQNYASLYDRVALKFQALGLKQKYGTQVNISQDLVTTLMPCDGTKNEIEQNRKSMGLEPLDQHMQNIKTFYKLPKTQ